MEKTVIRTEGAPRRRSRERPYNQAIIAVGDFVFVAGQLGISPAGPLPRATWPSRPSSSSQHRSDPRCGG